MHFDDYFSVLHIEHEGTCVIPSHRGDGLVAVGEAFKFLSPSLDVWLHFTALAEFSKHCRALIKKALAPKKSAPQTLINFRYRHQKYLRQISFVYRH